MRVEHGVEQIGRRSSRPFQVQLLAKPDEKLDLFGAIQPLRVDPAQALAGQRQVLGFIAFAEALEVGARDDEIDAVGGLGSPGLVGRQHGIVESPLVIELPGAGQRILLVGRPGRRAAQAQQDRRPRHHPGTHGADGSTRQILP